METKDLFKSFYESYKQSYQGLISDHTFPEYFYDLFLAGQSTIYQKNITETKTFDEEWIRTVESYFPSLNKIALEPKSVLRYDEEVVAVEKARKINSQSIRHLASNTQNIREVTTEMVIPKKILTTFPEVEYGTYENRMVMTLIDKLFHFVRNRYDIIKNNVESFQKKHFNLTSDFKILGTEATVKVDVILKEDLDNKDVNEYNQNLLKRVAHLDKLVTSIKNGSFMKLMENQKKVHAPIIKSNIIIKNVDYKNAYMLWLFLDRYNTLAFDLDIKEKDLTFDEAYLQDINQMALTNFSTILYNQSNRKEVYDLIKDKKYKRRGLKVVRKNVEDFIFNPEEIEVEDHAINQYYLNQFKSYFKKSIEYHEAQSKTYETTLKKALRETLKITNSLYDSFFELNEEDDVFRKLIKDQDPVVELRDAKEKAMIAKLIREVKEVDYNDAIRQEKKLLNDISSLDKKLIQASTKNKLITSKKVKSVESLRRESQLATKRKQALDLKLKANKFNDEELTELRKKVNYEVNTLARDLKKMEEEELNVLRKNLADKYETEIKKLSDEHKAEVKKLNDHKKEELLKIRKEKQEKVRLEKEKAKVRLQKEKEKELQKQKEKIAKAKAKLQQDLAKKKESK